MEYLVTSENITVADSLKDRLRISMPVSEKAYTGKCIGKLTRTMYAANFVIHMASEVNGVSPGRIESCNYCVSFLGENGLPMLNCEEVWILGATMASIVSACRKKIKFVYDETTHLKTGVVHRTVLSQQQELA